MDDIRQNSARPDAVAQKHSVPAKAKRFKLANRKALKNGLIVLVLVGLVGLAYGYIHTRNQLHQLSSNPKAATQNETQNLTSQVGKLVQLPTGETPTIATVNDASKLKSQTFFAHAQNGDKVLIYTKAGQAVLYRPSANKVIQFSTVNLGSQ